MNPQHRFVASCVCCSYTTSRVLTHSHNSTHECYTTAPPPHATARGVVQARAAARDTRATYRVQRSGSPQGSWMESVQGSDNPHGGLAGEGSVCSVSLQGGLESVVSVCRSAIRGIWFGRWYGGPHSVPTL